MAYNISNWRTKKLDGFKIRLQAIHEREYKVRLVKDNKVMVSGDAEQSEIKGVLHGTKDAQVIEVTDIHHSGIGSGTSWEGFKSVLGQSKGLLVAVQVWEGGDSMARLTIQDGQVEEEGIDI